MNTLIMAALVGTFVGGAGTFAGAVACFPIKRAYRRLPFILMAFSGGVMIAIVLFDMIAEAFSFSGLWFTVAGMGLGALFVAGLNLLFPRRSAGGQAGCFDAERITRTGLMLCAGIAIHNFPEGLAIGSGLSGPTSYGVGLSLLLLFHNIPEGMAMSLPMLMGGEGKGKVALLALAAGMPTALGAALGCVIGGVSPGLIGALIAFAGGAMLYITLFELIPETLGNSNRLAAAAALISGVAVGGALVIFV